MKLKFKKRTKANVVNRLKKKVRIRKVVTGTEARPRLTVYRSLKYIYAQVIDDVTGTTLVQASSLEKELGTKKGKEAATAVGAEVAKRAISKKVSAVVFDRNGYLYHGQVQALADAAREAGLKF
ncbi:MAG: 50S ribosomal protein L18 [Bdellovibrionales bacterium]